MRRSRMRRGRRVRRGGRRRGVKRLRARSARPSRIGIRLS